MEHASELYRDWLGAFAAIGTPAIGRDTAARILAVTYVHGNNEALVYNPNFVADLDYICKRFHIHGAGTPDADFAELLRKYVGELEHYEKSHEGEGSDGGACISDSARVYGRAKVYGEAMVGGKAEVCGDAVIRRLQDYYVSRNTWSSGRYFTYTRSNRMWRVGCFFGTGDELIAKAYKDSEVSGREYKRIVEYVEAMYAALDKDKEQSGTNL